jgi:hypothetical protein
MVALPAAKGGGRWYAAKGASQIAGIHTLEDGSTLRWMLDGCNVREWYYCRTGVCAQG